MQQAEEMWPCSMSATGRFSFAARGEEVLHVPPRGRGGEELRFLVLLVLGILLALVEEVAVDRRAARPWE